MPEASVLLAAALTCAARGWHVFPLRPDHPHAAEDEAKRPAFPNRCTAARCDRTDPRCRAAERHVGWEDRATTDPTRIRRAWTHRPYGVGIACGPSGLLVVDLDVPKHPDDTPPAEWAGMRDGVDVLAALAARHGGTVDATYTQSTGRGGSHLFYRHPDTGPRLGNTVGERGGLGWKVDTKSHGGYVVAAGSTINARPYTVALDCDPCPLPGWLASLLTPAVRPAYRPAAVALPPDRHGRYVAAAIRRQVDHLTTAPEGERNNVLFISAAVLGELVAGGVLTEDDVSAALEPAALSTGLSAREVARTIASGLRAGARRPRHLNAAGRAA
ncbi:bifunctional DNA primase/polymerase [Micromonospora sp. WMMA1363]|uniref:bifunctional DNA primase/polymerase n=1 Tax=Micromonospora sp. WMMA1363 TaxID=3053985 RepID=UPI00259C8029|nr:bifunctional DNA primase/polymerase [Micromonospora sp. WMMA1363]MDM4720118.1 bifunctional DNA primase/polymerase [Micromonospora sp. WMMA1363]MDM4722978.1 bifunctional DNA primase/polymerase [Micromonospora sp. WMMA1363]